MKQPAERRLAASRITRDGCTWSRRCCAAASPPKEAGKIAGGNYLHIFRAAVG